MFEKIAQAIMDFFEKYIALLKDLVSKMQNLKPADPTLLDKAEDIIAGITFPAE